MTTAAAPNVATASAGASPRLANRPARTISACCQAILAYFAIDPGRAGALSAIPVDELDIGEISHAADHLAMTLLLPMPYGAARMTVRTIGAPSISLPGLSLSPAIAAAAVGQPIGRLTGHPAFAELDHILVTAVAAGRDADGNPATILHFDDPAEPLFRLRHGAGSHLIH